MASPKSAVSKTDSKSSKKALGVSLSELESLFELMREHDITELDFQQKGQSFEIKRGGFVPSSGVLPGHAVMQPSAPRPAAPLAASAAPAPSTSGAPAIAANQKQITSPFVGTFYRAASPTAEPYVKEGSRIKPGDSLCIIEAMKLMNEIEAEISGRVVSVLVENGQPVEYGEPLFVVEIS